MIASIASLIAMIASIAGGVGSRGIEGMIHACQFARENKLPYFGICLGMQIAIIEFSRNVLKLKNANSTEFNVKTKNPVIGLVTEWKDASGKIEHRSESSNLELSPTEYIPFSPCPPRSEGCGGAADGGGRRRCVGSHYRWAITT